MSIISQQIWEVLNELEDQLNSIIATNHISDVAEELLTSVTICRTKFQLGTAWIFLKKSCGDITEHESIGLVKEAINEDDHVNTINKISEEVHDIATKAGLNLISVKLSIKSDDNKTNYKTCKNCSTIMAVNSSESVLRCEKCGLMKELVSTVFAGNTFHDQESQKTKSGTFNPNRHYESWMLHILAKEPEEEIGVSNDPANLKGEKLIKELRDEAKNDGIILQLITTNWIRKKLRLKGKPSLYKNISLIKYKMTGIRPPDISEDVQSATSQKFSMIVTNKSILSDSGNRSYYPFYITKLLDLELDKEDMESRRIFSYIHHQSSDTIIADDNDWKQLCSIINLEYRPTDMNQLI